MKLRKIGTFLAGKLEKEKNMRGLRWVLSILLILSLLAFGSTGWAKGKYKPQNDKDGWYDERDERYDDRPPGWDKGRKTGWRGHDLPPGQEKKYRQRYEDNYRYRYPTPVPCTGAGSGPALTLRELISLQLSQALRVF